MHRTLLCELPQFHLAQNLIGLDRSVNTALHFYKGTLNKTFYPIFNMSS